MNLPIWVVSRLIMLIPTLESFYSRCRFIKSLWRQEGIKFQIIFEDYWTAIPTTLISKCEMFSIQDSIKGYNQTKGGDA